MPKCCKIMKDMFNSPMHFEYLDKVTETYMSTFKRSDNFWEFLHFYQREEFVEETKKTLSKPGQFLIHSNKSEINSHFPKFDVVYFGQTERFHFQLNVLKMNCFDVYSAEEIIKTVDGNELLPYVISHCNGSHSEKSFLLPNGLNKIGTKNVKTLQYLGNFSSRSDNFGLNLVEFKKSPTGFPEKAIGKDVNSTFFPPEHINAINEALLLQKLNQHSKFFVEVLGVNYNKGTTVYYHYGTSLQCILLSNKGKISQEYKLKWTTQAANGLKTLKELGFVHRHLSCGQCFIGQDGNLKIGDLRRAVSESLNYIEYETSQIRWLAPESLWNNEYSYKSEVWAYGVLVWSIYSEGDVPYAKVSDSQVKIRMQRKFQKRNGKHFKGNFSLKMHETYPQFIATLIESCWFHCLRCRPDIEEITQQLNNLSI